VTVDDGIPLDPFYRRANGKPTVNDAGRLSRSAARRRVRALVFEDEYGEPGALICATPAQTLQPGQSADELRLQLSVAITPGRGIWVTHTVVIADADE
jgi:hypothetical protein